MTIYSQCIPTGNNASPYVQHIHFCGDVHIEDFVFFQEDGEVKFIYQDPADTCLSLMAEILIPSPLDMYVYQTGFQSSVYSESRLVVDSLDLPLRYHI